MRTVLISHDIGEKNLEWLKGRFPMLEFHMPGSPLPARPVEDAEILLGWINADILEKAVNLKWFHSSSAGVDTFLSDVDRLRGDLLVTNGAGIYGVPISEHLLAMMLALTRRIGLAAANMPQGKWGGLPPCEELHGSTVGVAGFGDIGRHLARLLVPFGCEVLAFKRQPSKKPPEASEMLYGEDGLDELMARSDHICVCLPGSPATAGMIGRRRIGLMKKTACFYNIGRGYTVDTDALADALTSGAIAGAGLDVTDPEPLPPGHPLWRLPNVVITPHIAGQSPHWHRRIAEYFAANLDEYLAGRPMPGLVDRINKY